MFFFSIVMISQQLNSQFMNNIILESSNCG